MRSLSVFLTELLIDKEWITNNEENRAWCIYMLETKILSLIFFLSVFVCSAVFKKIPETIIFTLVFYNLRRRLGGAHLNNAWACQLLSLAIVLFVTVFFGPVLEHSSLTVLLIIDAISIILVFLRTPVYQAQLHFDEEIKIANNKKKIPSCYML